MIPITPERLREIEELCNAAVNGGWHGAAEAECAASVALAAIPELIAAVRSLALTWTDKAPTEPG